ncbi:MAG: hypothetical protein II919_06290 [Lachnospiraceae bacterium]|nr:hypothetical protein [Lachnospiraceae bacterium]
MYIPIEGFTVYGYVFTEAERYAYDNDMTFVNLNELRGWKIINGSWYYFNTSGEAQTGWSNIGGKWYFFNDKGVMKTGWQEIDGKIYYLKKSGEMAAKEWIGGYRLNSNGTWTYEYKAAWKKDDKGWRYADASGWYAKNTTIMIDGKSYTFNADGYIN